MKAAYCDHEARTRARPSVKVLGSEPHTHLAIVPALHAACRRRRRCRASEAAAGAEERRAAADCDARAAGGVEAYPHQLPLLCRHSCPATPAPTENADKSLLRGGSGDKGA